METPDILDLPLFAAEWYRRQIPEGFGPLNAKEHLMRYGMENLADTHPLFHSKWYVNEYPDIRADNWVPLHHYLLYGWKEGRRPNPFFDVARYLTLYRIDGEPLSDYVSGGWEEGREPNSRFDGLWYAKANNLSEFDNPLEHFLLNRRARKLDPSPLFDGEWYASVHPEAQFDPYLHYLTYGVGQDLPGTNIFGDGIWSKGSFQSATPCLEKLAGKQRQAHKLETE